MSKQKGFSVNIGFSSILMVFIMICLVTFATLSVLTANSDYRLSQKTADKTTNYYNADTIAKNMTYQIDQALAALYQSSSDEAAYYDGVSTNIVFFELPENVRNFAISTESDVPVISYEVTISDTQTLYVGLEVHYPQSQGESFCRITQWQTKTSDSLDEPDTHLHLFGG